MDGFFTLIARGMFIEGIISYSKTIYEDRSIQWQIIAALCISMLFCYDTDLNFFAMIGLTEKFPLIGIVATSIAISRGSNYMFEFYNQLFTGRKMMEASSHVVTEPGE